MGPAAKTGSTAELPSEVSSRLGPRLRLPCPGRGERGRDGPPNAGSASGPPEGSDDDRVMGASRTEGGMPVRAAVAEAASDAADDEGEACVEVCRTEPPSTRGPL